MIGKTMMAAVALATVGAVPAMAQSTTSTGTSGQMTTPNGLGTGMDTSSSMSAPTAPKMTKGETATWKKCQAMTSDKMMKNKTCMKMSKMPGMNHDAM